MSVTVIPRMSPEDLEKILEILPEPTYAEATLYGDFDYSDILHHATELLPGVKQIKVSEPLKIRLESPLKKEILEIYRNSYRTVEDIMEAYETRGEIDRSKGVDLDKVIWNLNKVGIKLTPYEINVNYNGKEQEPEYVSKLRQIISKTKLKLNIEIIGKTR